MAKLTYDARHYSWQSMVDAVHEPVSAVWDASYVASTNGPSPIWDLGCDFDAFLSLLDSRTEWTDGRNAIEKQAAEQATRQIRKHPALDYLPDVTGDFFDLAAITENRPEQWLSLQETPGGTDRAIVNLVISVSASCGISADTIAERMRAIAACALTLESASIPVALYTVSYTSDHANMRMAKTVRVKDAGQPIDMRRIVCIAHPAYLRRAMFRLTEQTPNADFATSWRHGYGYPANPTSEELSEWLGIGESVYLPSLVGGDNGTETAAILNQLMTRRLGVPFDADDDGKGDYDV